MALGISILIIDDDPEIRKSLSIILENNGYYVQSTKNGKEATKLLTEQHFDIALVDIGLPDMRGIELLHRLKFISPRIMMIMITGSSDINDTVDAVNSGADGYILKPIDIEKLLELTLNLLKKKNAHDVRDWIKNKEKNKKCADNPKYITKKPW